MPNNWLSVPHFEQSVDGACLPACARMVTAFWGEQFSEATLAFLLNTKRSGTPLFNIKQLENIGYKITVTSLTQKELETYIDQGQPVIARVWTTMLDLDTPSASHVVVVVGYDNEFVYLNDPAFYAHHRPVLWDAFLAAWAEYDEISVIIARA